jgi:[acyl-carrier-protein] S-malonyltransferase
MAGPLAVLCSGQGGQHPAMFDLVAGCPQADPVFRRAAEILGQDPRRFAREAAPAVLFSNLSGQILCCTQTLAMWAALGELRPPRAVIAGYSVGELAAWGCAAALDEVSTLRLAQRRASLMDTATLSDGGLAAILGLSRPALEPILARHGVSIAIINDVDSFVAGGQRTSLAAACQEAIACGAKRCVDIPVAVASHTPALSKATEQFRLVLRKESPRLPRSGYRLLSGIDGSTIHDVEVGIDNLARQISTPVDWAACLESCRSAGARVALELGPGTALSRMAAAAFPDGCARSVDEFRTLDGLRAWLQRAME